MAVNFSWTDSVAAWSDMLNIYLSSNLTVFDNGDETMMDRSGFIDRRDDPSVCLLELPSARN